MYENILVPTDGSKGAEAAADHAIDHASQYGGALHTIFAVNTDVAGAYVGAEFAVGELEAAGEEAVQTIADRAREAGVEDVHTAVVRGQPHRAILEYVDENEIDLVVMGTHGRTGIDRYLLGSVTEKVVRLCECPVLTVRLDEDDV